MKKKVLALVLALVMTLTLLPVTALAANVASVTFGGTTTEYPTIDAAWDAAIACDTAKGNEATIKLLANCAVATDKKTLTKAADYIILDTNGYTLTTGTNSSPSEGYKGLDGIAVTGGELLVTGSGTITGKTASSYAMGILVVSGGIVTVDGPTINNVGSEDFNAAVAVNVSANGEFHFKSGRLVSAKEYGLSINNNNTYLYSGTIESSGSCAVPIGSFLDTATIVYSENPLIFINHNTSKIFSKSSSNRPYVSMADGCTMDISYGNNADGTGTTLLTDQTSITETANAAKYMKIQTKVPVPTYTVTFDANGHGTAPAAIENVTSGSTITAPTAPAAEGYIFGGWYTEATCVNEWDFSTDTVSTNTTLYAKWIEAYTITLDSTNYTGSYLSLTAYTNGEVSVGEISDNNATISVPKDGFVQVAAIGNFTVAADGATVGDMQESELNYYVITNFTKDTTIVINPTVTVSEVTLKVDWTKVPELVVGEPVPDPVMFNAAVEHYMTVTCENLDGFEYGWSVKDPSSSIGYRGLNSDNDITSTDEYYLTVVIGLKPGGTFTDAVTLKVDDGTVAEIIEKYNDVMIVVFELGTLEEIEDAKDNAANTPTYPLGGAIAALDDDSITVATEDGVEVVKFNTADAADGFFYYTNLVPVSALGGKETAQTYVDLYNSAATGAIVDVAGGDATPAHAMAAQVFPINMKDPTSPDTWTLEAEQGAVMAVIYKLHKDNYIYDAATFGSTTPYAYAVYGVHAEIVTPSGTTPTPPPAGDTDTPTPPPADDTDKPESEKPVIKPTTTPSYDPTPVVPPANVDIHDDTLYDAAQAVYAAVKNGKADFTPVAGYTKEVVIQMQKDDALKLVVEKKSSFDPAEKALIDKTVEEKDKGALVQFLEIDVTLRTMADVIVAEVDDTIVDLSITVDLNDEMQKAAKDGKTIYVARSHDGKVAFLEGKLNADKTKVTFDSSKFSTYALVAFDSKTVVSPKTADAGILLAVSMSILSVTGSAVLLKKKED